VNGRLPSAGGAAAAAAAAATEAPSSPAADAAGTLGLAFWFWSLSGLGLSAPPPSIRLDEPSIALSTVGFERWEGGVVCAGPIAWVNNVGKGSGQESGEQRTGQSGGGGGGAVRDCGVAFRFKTGDLRDETDNGTPPVMRGRVEAKKIWILLPLHFHLSVANIVQL